MFTLLAILSLAQAAPSNQTLLANLNDGQAITIHENLPLYETAYDDNVIYHVGFFQGHQTNDDLSLNIAKPLRNLRSHVVLRTDMKDALNAYTKQGMLQNYSVYELSKGTYCLLKSKSEFGTRTTMMRFSNCGDAEAVFSIYTFSGTRLMLLDESFQGYRVGDFNDQVKGAITFN